MCSQRRYPDRKLGRPRKGVIPLPKEDRFIMVARYNGKCVNCGGRITKGKNMWFTRSDKSTEHIDCKDYS